MRKLDLSNYNAKGRVPDSGNPGREIDAEIPFYVKTSIINLLFIPALQLSGAEVLRQNILAMKLEACKDEILLEEEEWGRIKKSVETFKGFDRNAVELVRRVLEAPIVEVHEKPAKG